MKKKIAYFQSSKSSIQNEFSSSFVDLKLVVKYKSYYIFLMQSLLRGRPLEKYSQINNVFTESTT